MLLPLSLHLSARLSRPATPATLSPLSTQHELSSEQFQFFTNSNLVISRHLQLQRIYGLPWNNATPRYLIKTNRISILNSRDLYVLEAAPCASTPRRFCHSTTCQSLLSSHANFLTTTNLLWKLILQLHHRISPRVEDDD